jgi:hypothetical protein
MPNYYGRLGAPMLQPTKDELRRRIRDLRTERDEERVQRIELQRKLDTTAERLDEAARLLGRQLIEASIKGDFILPAPEPLRLLRRPLSS